jgi:predicted hydrocarbon binding protein
MFKQLKIYYVFVTLPFVLLLLGSGIFINAIKSTIVRNPHPQINYAIFVIILFGGVLITLSAHRLVREARTLTDYSNAVRANTDWATLQKMTENYTGDISYLLQMVAASGGRSISHQEQAAIEHEHNAARNHLTRRNGLPQYLTGLLVGMGLLGTFIGLLSTLTDISTLIGSFAELDMSTASPLLVFRTMIERMKAPMQSMSIAFSASMFGLLGSIILGLMMVGIRRLQADIFSVLGSEVARHIELALAYESAIPGKGASVTSGTEAAYTGDEYKVLIRIEERLADAARLQQRALSSEIDDFQKQRADMLRVLAEQTEASNNFRSELQQLGRQLGAIFSSMEKENREICAQLSELTVHLAAEAKESLKLVNVVEKGNGEMSTQISELTVHLATGAKESHKLLAMQVDEQKRLRDTLDSYKIEERLAEAARLQQRTLASEMDDFQRQRADMLRVLTEQTEASNNFSGELQQFGRQLGSIFNIMEKGNGEICTQISELMVHRAADAKESHKLLSMQVNEQKRLRDSLDLRVTSNTP